VSQRVAALRFFFVKTLKRRRMLEHLPFPRLPEKIPTVLSRDEVGRLLAASAICASVNSMTRIWIFPRLQDYKIPTAAFNQAFNFYSLLSCEC
jgi:hypothetical protein